MLIFYDSKKIFVTPTSDYLSYLKRHFRKSHVRCNAANFHTAYEFREHIMTEFGISKRICTNGMISFCFNEVANRIDTTNCIQGTIIADKKASLHRFHKTMSSGANYENTLDKDRCLFFEFMKKEIAASDFILEQDLDKLL
jgi:hypothetical protein